MKPEGGEGEGRVSKTVIPQTGGQAEVVHRGM
jgi:hypothetical protein